MTRFITVTNRRGGVGKTTTTAMLAYGLAVQGFQKVLVVDLDAQSSTSITLMGQERWHLARRDSRTIADLMLGVLGEDLPDVAPYIAHQVGDVHITPGNRRPALSLIPGSFDLDETERYMLTTAKFSSNVDELFMELQSRAGRIIRSIANLADPFDYVIMDCPPGLSNIAWGAVEAADHVIVPYIPDATAEDNVGWLFRRIRELDEGKEIRVLANRVRTNNAYHKGIMDIISARYPSLGIAMPQRGAIEGALEFRTSPQSLTQKYGDGRMIIDQLFNATLLWVQLAETGKAA